MSYYNTVSETGEVLQKARRQCTKQEAYILSVYKDSFISFPTTGLTSDDVYQIVRERKMRVFKSALEAMYKNCADFQSIYDFTEKHYAELSYALISIRRSITDLTSAGYLEMTKQKRKGMSGRMNYIYKLK